MSESGQKTSIDAWKNMSQEVLELEYSCQIAKRMPAEEIIPAFFNCIEMATKITKDQVPHRLDVAYGTKPGMKVDVYGEDLQGESPVFLFIHGGYWQKLSKDTAASPVMPLYKNGIVTVVLDYDLCPTVTMEEIVSQARAAVKWTCEFAKKRGSKGVVISGHSAGGHLVTEVLSVPIEASTNTDLTAYQDIIHASIPISGVFDLRPLVKTTWNKALKMTESSSWSLSPMGQTQDHARYFPKVKLLVAVGKDESSEFRRQSEDYTRKCKEAGLDASYLEMEDCDHFNIVEDMAVNSFPFTKRVLEFVKRTC